MEEYSILQGIAQLLVQQNVLSLSIALYVQNLAQSKNQAFLETLAQEHHSSQLIALTISESFGIPLFDLDSVDLSLLPLNLMSPQLVQRHRLLPLHHRNSNLYLATDDPSQTIAFKEVQFSSGLICCPIVVETSKLQKMIDQVLSEKEIKITSLGCSPAKYNSNTSLVSPVVKLVDEIIHEAIKKAASDIHFEPYEQEFRVRFRLDGLLVTTFTPPPNLTAAIIARLKIMAQLDISERRLPQDGRFTMKSINNRSIEFRVSSCPLLYGEKIVLRLFHPSSFQLNICNLGFNEIQERHFRQALQKPQGMIIVTGPTGSGKTVTLYSALNLLNTIDRNISTVENPVEIPLQGINQVNINPKAGLNFSNTLRAFLRQDPDVVMVGEIRDLETADIAIKAAQTGHLVLTTLHTNSATETLSRLINMGIPAFNIASSLTLLIAQRLARRLCDICKKERQDLSAKNLLELGFEYSLQKPIIYQAQSCRHCHNGYRGRIGLFEVVPISKNLASMICSDNNAVSLFKQAQLEGMISVYQSGLEKIREGVTTIEEVNRVTMDYYD